MQIIDFSIVLIYFIFVVVIGFYRSKNASENSNNYILAGRRLSLPGFVATLVTTWYGGVLGIGENTYNFGIQTWFIFGLPYYFFAILFAILIAPRIRKLNFTSIPDHIHDRFGKNAGVISGLFLLFLASPAPYILSIGILLEYTVRIPFLWALIVATIFSLIYIWKGGLGAIVRTDIFQFILMFGGFILLIIFAWIKIGSPIEIFKQLPAEHLSPTGGNTIQYIFVWFFIAMWTFIDPGFYQRCAAAKSPKTAQKGILISVLFWFIFDSLTLTSGLYARALLTHQQGLFAFPALGQALLPPLFYGLFITGLLATIMSTIDSLGFISAFTFGRDIVGRIKEGANHTFDNSIFLIRVGLILMATIAVILAFAFPSVVKLWYITGSIFVPGLLIPFLLTLTKLKLRNRQGQILLIIPVLVSIMWFILNSIIPDFSFKIEPFYPGIFSSILLFVSFIIINRKRNA
ncbi:sodium:solute symporter family protein [bacterium]|nr:sodium:solute symporter family protein [bacterium]